MTRFTALLSLILFHFAVQAQDNIIRKLEKDLPALMQRDEIPGLAIALIQDGKITWTNYYGYLHAGTKQPVTASTIFEAASLSKVVTAYGALQLVDAGKLHLDTPLTSYLGNTYDVKDDPRISQVTARRVLSHSAGFPNWRSGDTASLPINFNPGEKFSYSGEGFVYLAKVIEKRSGQPFNEYIQQHVFTPLGMKNTSFRFEDRFDSVYTTRHNWLGEPTARATYRGANAAASLRTTVVDYAMFMTALLNNTGLKAATLQQLFTPQISVDKATAPRVAWGLGVGLEVSPAPKTFWHWGDQGDSRCFMIADIEKKNGVVYFTNSNNGLSPGPEIVADVLGTPSPALAWLDYGRYDPRNKALLHAIDKEGADKALGQYNKNGKGLAEGQLNTLGYYFLRNKQYNNAIAVFEQNTRDYPKSANVWDSLAEAYLENGNHALALKYYTKALELNPGSTGAADAISRIKALGK